MMEIQKTQQTGLNHQSIFVIENDSLYEITRVPLGIDMLAYAQAHFAEATLVGALSQQAQEEHQAVQAYSGALQQITTGWDGLSASGKVEALRQMDIILTRLWRQGADR